MKIYLAGDSMTEHVRAHHGVLHVAHPSHPLRILLSYHYYQNTDLETVFAKYFSRPYPEVFLDSGAFSAFSQGKRIDLNAYCAYIKRFKPLLTVYSNLDVIGSASGTLANQNHLEEEGLAPLPVFHIGEDWSYLQDYVKQYAYIALGGLVPYMRSSNKVLMSWLTKCFKLVQGKSVFHGFGCTAWSVVCALPWYSVDSSSWGQGFRYGDVPVFNADRGKFVKMRWGNHQQCYEYAPLLRSLGYDPADFAEQTRRERGKVAALAAFSYMKAEQWLEHRHGIVTIPEREKVS